MQNSFYGWYLKCQSDTQTLAVIPAVHQTERQCTCSIQIITDNNAWSVTYPGDVFRQIEKNIFLENNQFGEKGIKLSINRPELTAKGELSFGSLSALKYDIMGPFVMVPFMQCRHSVWSMKHLVNGTVNVNGQQYVFQNGYGYWEGDRGRSFPKEYLWTQCFFPEGSLMLSVADIPMTGFHFTGIIGVVLWQGKEYRIATYLGAKAAQIGNKTVRIVQGDMELEAWLLEAEGKKLKAPIKGDMVRTIHESVACRAFYRLKKEGQTLLEFETERAAFEYEYKS